MARLYCMIVASRCHVACYHKNLCAVVYSVPKQTR